MDKIQKGKIDELRAELEAHFNKALSPRMREAFVRFALENFETFENFEKAAELVASNVISFGLFPPFPKFLELYREHRQANTGAYAEYKALPSASGESGYSYRCLCCLDQGLIPNYLLVRYGITEDNNTSPYAYRCQRCSAGRQQNDLYCRNIRQDECDRIHEEERRLRQSPPNDIARLKAKVHVAGFLKRPDFRAEAIDEATLKGIDLASIGVLENVETDITTVFPA